MLARIDAAISKKKSNLSKPNRMLRFRPSSRYCTKKSVKKLEAVEVVVGHLDVLTMTNSDLTTPSMTKIAWTKTRVDHQVREEGTILSIWEALLITTMLSTIVHQATLGAKLEVEEVYHVMIGKVTTFSAPTVHQTTVIVSSIGAVHITTVITNHEVVEAKGDTTGDETCCDHREQARTLANC